MPSLRCEIANVNTATDFFFATFPDESYWYYSPGLRVPRPEQARRPSYDPAPWEWLQWASRFTCRKLEL